MPQTVCGVSWERVTDRVRGKSNLKEHMVANGRVDDFCRSNPDLCPDWATCNDSETVWNGVQSNMFIAQMQHELAQRRQPRNLEKSGLAVNSLRISA